MMEFQLLDVDYLIVDGKPVVRVLGKAADGQVVCGFCDDYSPYFYVDSEGAVALIKDNPQVVSIEKVQRNVVMGYQEPKWMFKVILRNPSRTPEIRDYLLSKGFTPYEADILFKYRYMADKGLSGMGWLRAKSGGSTNTGTTHADRKFTIRRLGPAKIRENAQLGILALDIECVPLRHGTVPMAERDPIVMISLVFSSPYKGLNSIVLGTKNVDGMQAFESEGEMLAEFVDIVNGFDPDVLTGYNINNFDLPYILERMAKTGVKPVFGRCRQKGVSTRKVGLRYKASIFGRIIVDSYEIIRKDFSLKRYDLGSVAEALLKQKKGDVKHSEIEKLWRGGRDDLKRLADYCRVDSQLAMDLVVRLNILDKYIALAKVSGVLLQDTIGAGETTRIENYLLREFNKAGYVLPCKPDQKDVKTRDMRSVEELKGGYVIDPQKKLHSSVLVFDFRAMYPSIIRTFNICPTTVIITNGIDDPIISPSGARFVPKTVREGVLPKILERVMRKRMAVQKKLKAAGLDPEKKRVLHSEQWALKIMANAFYGHIGYSRARIYDLAVANSITAYGREMIQKTKKMIEEAYGYPVIYGDTDSVMVKADADLEKLPELGSEIAAHITKELPGIMELQFEKIFKRFLPLTKKRYFALWVARNADGTWRDGIEMKGVETVRRDWCGLVSETVKEVVELILRTEDTKEAVKYFRGLAEKLLSGGIPLQKLVITKTITKQPGSYVGMQPHVELLKKMQARSPAEAPGIGDRVGYVIVKGTGLVSKRAEDPAYVIERGLQVDSRYYIENQLLPPLERVFNVLGISKSELLGNGKQLGVFERLKESAKQQAVLIDAIRPEEFNGFLCIECNRFYGTMPLAGGCDCGGVIKFSSLKGPAESVITN
ncbi:MAG: hypothetical protein HY518_03125 [Candidatus Aenigmarchaeota archaeon]|nr:hypothetical protein [Candidatus Aenigmarchaeota archaeon]